jgi:hypothetical protein
VLDSLCPDGREEPEEHHIPAQVGVNIQGRDGPCFPNCFIVNMDIDPYSGKRRKIGTFKGMQRARADLGREENLTLQ